MISYLQNVGPDCLVQDDNALQHRTTAVSSHNLGVEEMEWPAVSAGINPADRLWDDLWHAGHARVTSRTCQSTNNCWLRNGSRNGNWQVTSMRRWWQVVVAMYQIKSNFMYKVLFLYESSTTNSQYKYIYSICW